MNQRSSKQSHEKQHTRSCGCETCSAALGYPGCAFDISSRGARPQRRSSHSGDRIFQQSPVGPWQVPVLVQHVWSTNSRQTRLGLLPYNGNAVCCRNRFIAKGRIVIEGTLAEFGEVILAYGVKGNNLYCTVARISRYWHPDCETPYWEDCVYLRRGGTELRNRLWSYSQIADSFW